MQRHVIYHFKSYEHEKEFESLYFFHVYDSQWGDGEGCP